MGFKDLLDKYKKGILTEEEKKVVDQEIEKHQAIEEYLMESIDDIDFKSLREDEELNEETMEIKKSVNNRLRKVVMTSVAIVLAIILSLFLIISPIIDSFYYNPTSKSVGEHHNDIFYDMKAINELNRPGLVLGIDSYTENLGFGRYNVNYKLRDIFTQQEIPVSFKINRNNIIYSQLDNTIDEDYYYTGFMTIWQPDFFIAQDYIKQKERVMDHLKKLSPASYVSAYITFKEDLTMEELSEINQDYNVHYVDNPTKVNIVWAAIRTSPKGEKANYITGFSPLLDSARPTDLPDKEKYPLFSLEDIYNKDNDLNKKIRNESLFPTAYETHYTSLLKYLVDREKAVEVLEWKNKYEYYQSALNYVEENGVKTFGVLVYADAEDLIRFVEEQPVKTLVIHKVLASKPYID